MSDDTAAGAPQPEEETQPPYMIEGARSARSKCKICRKKIDKDVLRLGTLIEGPFGTGYVWEHLRCAAKRAFEKVEEAYAAEAWNHAKEPPEVPALEELAKLREEAEQKRAERRELPYAEVAPSGRSRCKHCGEPIPKDELRVVLAQEVVFGSQTRTASINVLPEHVAEALRAPDSGTAPEGLAEALRENSRGLDEAQLDALVERIGPLD